MLINMRKASDTACSTVTPYGVKSRSSAASRVPSPEGAIGRREIIPVMVKTEIMTGIDTFICREAAISSAHKKYILHDSIVHSMAGSITPDIH